ncbi:MAG: bifunctional (p)ppGpp synthetase/guanosine-3',5'-bis(diphosphate) 3'-pyrophosphohydrolase [Acidobacteria bacterium]|nr:MAG: bifunctional (p)ppGpp synthetase/guanosine-3',5'-bis(diphosphate) 3'-pyrophosphohydrolase [Acidobacteriota bacterium]
MIRFENILEKVRAYQPDGDIDLLRRAYVFSAREHRGQLRKSGEPYLIHPLEVANILAEMQLDVVCVICGLLHDVVEDTLTTSETVEEFFGTEVAHIIDGLTKISKMNFSSVEERQAENFRKMLMAMVDDIRIILIKLADRLHNMRTLQHLSEERRIRIANETLEIYAPLAGRLGIGKIKTELEELCLKNLEPKAYGILLARVDAKRKWSQDFITEIKGKLEKTLNDNGIAAEIHGRTKNIYSIHQKMKRQRIELDQVYDFIALRIVTDSVQDCYGTLGIIHNTWRPVPGRIKDFIAMPRPNGYRSLHTSVITDSGAPFEVQIRTSEMHKVAEQGIAAHWKYKEGRPLQEDDVKNFAWLRQILDWQLEVEDPNEFLNELKVDLYPEDVFCFTPKGEVKSFPRGATPVDFAYSIHTDVGHQCVGSRVNGLMVPLRYKLRNGDIVEVLTARGHKPSRDWLSFVATSRARNKIRTYLNATEKIRSIEIGRKLLEKEAGRSSVNLKQTTASEPFAEALKDYGFSKTDDLYAAVGYGKLSPRNVLARLIPASKLEEKPGPGASLARAVRRVFRGSDDKIKVNGMDDLMVYRANCCNPVPGESITGYITRGKGVSVHSVICSNLLNLMVDPERRIDVSWDGEKGTKYDITLSVNVEDRKGILADITSIIADSNTDIRTVEAKTFEDQKGSIDVTVSISNVKELERITKSIREVDGVLGVARPSSNKDPDRSTMV